MSSLLGIKTVAFFLIRIVDRVSEENNNDVKEENRINLVVETLDYIYKINVERTYPIVF